MSSHQVETLKPTYLNKESILEIEPMFTPVGLDESSFDLFLISLEQLIEKIFPPSILDELYQCNNEQLIEKSFRKLNKNLPIFNYSFSMMEPQTLSITLLCHSEYTHGIGRYINDMCSRWLLPGKQLPIVSNRSMSFKFKRCPKYLYFLNEIFVRLSDEKEQQLIEKTLSNFLKEMRINILAVYHARYIVSVKSLSFEEKSAIIQENITSLLQLPTTAIELNVFDQMQHLLLKISSEEKIKEVEKNISYLLHKRPRFFDRDVFYEIRLLLLQLRNQFIFERDAKHISRIICFQYLFKKTLLRLIQKTPNQRHLSLKILKIKKDPHGNRFHLGLLISMNLLRDSERFEKRNILKTLKTIIPNIHYVKESYISDKGNDQIHFYYLEVEKESGVNFSFQEIKKLRHNLPKELKSRVQNVLHPIFMPRNEEEIIRNIIILSKQLKYVRDLPQVIISYDKQTDSELSFMVIMVRLLKCDSLSLKELLKRKKASLHISQDETKVIGYLKRKYPKESSIFRIFLDKTPFFRPDYSLDLQKARQKVVNELIHILGEFRDYNGGMIVKQNEVLYKLMDLIKPEHHFILENFFYSLKPGVMQSILSPDILYLPFMKIMESLEFNYEKEPYYFSHIREKNYQIVVIASENESFKNMIKNTTGQFKGNSLDLTTSTLKVHGIHVFSSIFKTHNDKKSDQFLESIKNSLCFWQKNYDCLHELD